MSVDDIESLKKYQEKYGVNLFPSSVQNVSVINLPEMTELQEDHEKLKEEFKHLESAFARLLETLNVTLNKLESRIEIIFYGPSQDLEVSKKDYFTNV